MNCIQTWCHGGILLLLLGVFDIFGVFSPLVRQNVLVEERVTMNKGLWDHVAVVPDGPCITVPL